MWKENPAMTVGEIMETVAEIAGIPVAVETVAETAGISVAAIVHAKNVHASRANPVKPALPVRTTHKGTMLRKNCKAKRPQRTTTVF